MNGFNNLALSCLFFSDLSAFAQSSIITTYAGRGRTLPVSGAQAVTQPIEAPSSVIPDAAGGFYIASRDLHRIYRVAADGTLTVIAGTGIAGFSGDGGPATSAQLGDGRVALRVRVSRLKEVALGVKGSRWTFWHGGLVTVRPRGVVHRSAAEQRPESGGLCHQLGLPCPPSSLKWLS